ncbi:hypothetical protein K469DRAFT_608551, partial [Zopfia rhizophila CBS 207.26]
QIVGQGIFLNIKHSRPLRQRLKARKWSTFVSRAILYRVDPDFEEPRANSGTAVCIINGSTETHKVAGFQSFIQGVSGNSTYEMDDDLDLFNKMLESGKVAFYGAFQVPPRLRENHFIVTGD